jgi:hypothetical protein
MFLISYGIRPICFMPAQGEWLGSFVDAPHAAIEGAGQGMFVNLADRRAAASRNRQLDLLNDMGPSGIVREITRIGGRMASVAKADTHALLPHLVLPEHYDRSYTRVGTGKGCRSFPPCTSENRAGSD